MHIASEGTERLEWARPWGRDVDQVSQLATDSVILLSLECPRPRYLRIPPQKGTFRILVMYLQGMLVYERELIVENHFPLLLLVLLGAERRAMPFQGELPMILHRGSVNALG